MLDQQAAPQATNDVEHASPDVDEAKKKRWQSPGWVATARRDFNATVWRLRRQLLPHAITGAVAGAGLAAHSIVASGGTPAAGLVLLTAIGGGATTWAAWIAAMRRRPRWAKRTLVAGATATAWLATTPFGITPEQIAALLAAEYAIGAGWWQANRLGYPGPETIQEDEPEMTLADQIAADWDEYNACDGGPLARSHLSNPQVTRHTVAFDLDLWRGRHTLTTALAALEKIAGGVDKDVDEVILETHPDRSRRSTARCRFQVITDSPISGDVDFDGPRRHDGILHLGPYADGSGEAPYRLYTPGSMWSGVIIGGTGIGKSRVVENIAISALSGGDTIIIYIDPKRGGSSPALAKHARVFVPGDEAFLAVEAILAGIAARGEENAAEGWTGFTPSPKRPGVLVIVEECHGPFADAKQAAKWAKVAREGRSVGVAVLGISQYAGIVTFGNNEALRSNIMQGNAIVLHATSNSAKQLMPGLQVDPKMLPRIPGYAYTIGNDEHGTRTAPFRNRDTGDDSELTGARLAAQPQPEIDTLLATAITHSVAGAAFLGRDSGTDGRQAVTRARVEALRNGIDPDKVAPRAKPAEKVADVAVDTGELGVIIEFPSPITPEQLERGPLVLGDSHRAVLAAVAAGKNRPAEIEDATGLRHRRVAELLKELVAAGHLIQPRYGRYQRAA